MYPSGMQADRAASYSYGSRAVTTTTRKPSLLLHSNASTTVNSVQAQKITYQYCYNKSMRVSILLVRYLVTATPSSKSSSLYIALYLGLNAGPNNFCPAFTKVSLGNTSCTYKCAYEGNTRVELTFKGSIIVYAQVPYLFTQFSFKISVVDPCVSHVEYKSIPSLQCS